MAEDANWLQPVREDKHINLAELDTVLWGINLALKWKPKTIHIRMDSACVHCWVLDTLSRQTRVRTKAPLEMLIRRRLVTLRQLVAEYELDIDMGLVKFHDNQADQLTRVTQRWLEEIRRVAEPKETMYAMAEELDVACIQAIHRSSRHRGVKRTLYFVKLVNSRVGPKGSGASGG